VAEPDRELMIGTGEHETYTEEYRTLTRDFYLKF
jgi:tRNA1Val (adenine37-N6)-methyltransferase